MPTKLKFEGDPAEYEVTTPEDVLKAVDGNHIWLSAFTCVNPTEETLLELGRAVMAMLNDQSNLLPMVHTEEELATLDPSTRDVLVSLSKLTPQLYLRVNKS